MRSGHVSFTEAIKNILNNAVADCFPDSGPAFECQVTPCQDKKFGDYQSNLAFLLAKRERTSPRNIAEAVAESVQAQMALPGPAGSGQARRGRISNLSPGESVGAMTAGALIETIEVAGAGFINIRLRDAALAAQLERTLADPRCGVARSAHPQRIVVDYSSPNLAKDLHVGTMRSTVIGDSIARVLEFLGHDVVRQNHFGDWGANFGVLVAMIKREYGAGLDTLQDAPLETVEELYARGSRLKKDSEEFAANAAAEVNNLQSGDPESVAVWEVLMDKTLRNCHDLYRTFNVSLDASHDCPESFYRDDLPRVVAELSDMNLLVDDDNAKCAYLDGFHNIDGDPLPVIVQKSDAGYNYSTTDLAGIRHRVGRLQAQQIIIVTDRGQELHFRMIRALAQKAGWLPDSVQLRHLGYGVILQEIKEGGRSKKVRFSTRDGGTVKIRELLAEGRRRSEKLTLERNPDIGGDELDGIAAKLTIAALKYAELKQRPVSDYTFNWDQMLASQGNTGVYILYCYVRVASLFGKSGVDKDALVRSPGSSTLSHELERELLVQLVSFPELFAGYEEELSSHDICHYLYELSTIYSRFWKDCPILTAAEDVRNTRLALSLAVANRLKLGLSLLGIEVVERM
ncbi:MAG: arginine--tRNA ligase [Gammaproteobacteria bacterium]|nr:arginine--tRNA ligase [Gammaproteobacteria bacterium]